MTDPYRPQPPQQPQAPYQAPSAAAAYGGSSYAAPPTNTLAVVSMIFGIASWIILPVIGPIVAVITGHVSLGQIKRTHEGGRGMALAGVIIGWVSIGLTVAFVIVLLILATGFFAIAATSGSLNS